MKDGTIRRQSFGGFTIVELLTVMSIIIILMGVLVPALSRVRRFAKVVTQKGQFYEIDKGLELYRNDHSDTYPDSDANDPFTPTVNYCGAMKLCETMMGQDGMGFNPASRFLASGLEPNGAVLYPFDLCSSVDATTYTENLRARDKYLDIENFRACNLHDLYGTASADVAPFTSTYKNAVICDVFIKAQNTCTSTGGRLGMPVLYYVADSSKLSHDVNHPDNSDNIYSFEDNDDLVSLGLPWDNAASHPMYDNPTTFYKSIQNSRITTPRPHNQDSYILISAGWDGLYGTRDDVFNFTDN